MNRIGVDIGGTFTDVVLLGPDGALQTKKVLSTPDDYARGVVQGILELLQDTGAPPASVTKVVHATTVASNAVLEGKGPRCCLLTTAGFRDVLEMRRLRIPVMYELQYEKPPPLVPRRLRFEIPERTGPRGEEWAQLDERAVREAAEQACAEGVGAIAISFLHAYANPTHERRAAEIVREVVGNDVYITCSSEILAEIREYERTSTAVVNAYVGPVVRNYIRSLESSLAEAGISAPLQIMQSSGGVMSADAAIRKPAHLVESGPAAGVVACAFLARATGIPNVISLDMGGTTAKAAILEDGQPVKTSEYEVGAGINLSSRLVKGGGHAIRLPFIDLSEIGAGGGSLVSVDEFGMLHVGPESAGADPGPACYARGGNEPTLTDALVVLGYLNREYLTGGAVPIDADAAASALEPVAASLGRDATAAAYGVFQLAVATMTRAVKAVSTYRGRDPRDFVLCGFGGNGPVVAVAIARELQMRRVLVPLAPGVFSAAGLLLSEIEHEFLQTLPARGENASAEMLHAAYRELEAEAERALVAEGVTADAIALSRFADIRYAGQAYELTLPVSAGEPDLGRIAADFSAEHHRTYGHASADAPIDIVNLKLTARASGNGDAPYDPLAGLGAQADERTRRAYFGPEHGSLDVPVLSRAALLDAPPREGPLIVEEYDATCVVPPGCRVTLDSLGNIDIDLGARMTAVAIDPVTLEVIKNGLASVADEMALVVMRSAYSPVVRDTMDYSTALCDRDGELVAQGLTLAVQLGTFPTIMRHVREHFGDDVHPGDVFLANDPYGFGGQHLPDIYVIQPIFHGGELEGYAATMAHHVDVGGITPGSIAVHATEIYQEGLRLPLLKLFEAGRENETVFRIIEKNTRQPIEVIGDLRAQISACRAGERGLIEILERYGTLESRRYMDELQVLSERLMRAELAALPDGVYGFEDFIDGFGDEPEPLRIAVELTVRGDEVWVDFEGTAAQVAAGLNCPVGMAKAGVYCAFRGIADREIPNTGGYMRPIHINAPEGTIVNPVLPAACGARGVIGYRVYDTVMGALAQIVPEKVVAPGEGGPTLVAIGGWEGGKPFVLTEVIVGCWGARATRDGLEGVSNPLANLANQPVELVESELPLRVHGYGLVADSGGPGRFRGGLAYERSYELLADEAVLTVRSDRRSHPPYGIGGGEAGAPSTNAISSAGGERVVPTMPMEALKLRRGDVFRHVSAGGGGSGPPFEREPALVLEDVLDGKVSVEAARERYGVVIAGGRVDEEATAAARS